MTLQEFQSGVYTKQEKEDWSVGEDIAREIMDECTGLTADVNSANIAFDYYSIRNRRIAQNRLLIQALSSNNLKTMDLTSIDGRSPQAAPIPMTMSHFASTIVQKVVSALGGRRFKVGVRAIDPLSQNKRDEQYKVAEFYLKEYVRIKALQEQAGIELIPEGQFIPQSRQALELWSHDGNLLPEEIVAEKKINNILKANGIKPNGSLTRQLIRDYCVAGFAFTNVSYNSEKEVITRRIRPEDSVYSASKYDDLRDVFFMGERRELSIKEIVTKYSKENGGHLTKADIEALSLASGQVTSTDYGGYTNIPPYNVSKPVGDFFVNAIEFEIKTVDAIYTTAKKTFKTESTILKRGKPAGEKENEEVLKDAHYTIYKCVCVLEPFMLLEWGEKTDMVLTDDPASAGDVEFSYSCVMPDQEDMLNLSLVDRIKDNVLEIENIKSKMTQLLASMVPAGYAVDLDALDNIDVADLRDILGNQGLSISEIYFKTGVLYYRSSTYEGGGSRKPIEPIVYGMTAQLNDLLILYRQAREDLSIQLGEDPLMSLTAVQPRVAASNVMEAKSDSENNTWVFFNAYLELIGLSAKKIIALSKKEIDERATLLEGLIKGEEQDSPNNYSTLITLMPSEAEVQMFMTIISQELAANPALAMTVNLFELKRLAQENVKQAELAYSLAKEKAFEQQRQQAEENSRMNAEQQQQAVIMKGEADKQVEQAKYDREIRSAKITSLTKSNEEVLRTYLDMIKSGRQPPPIIEQVALPILESMTLGNQKNGRETMMEMMLEEQQLMQQENQEMQEPIPQ